MTDFENLLNKSQIVKTSILLKNPKDFLQEFLTWQNILKTKFVVEGRHRYEIKLFALNLYLRSPLTYQFLENISILPPHETLHNIKINFKPGINYDLMYMLSLTLLKHNSIPDYKHCILCLDKMELKKNAYYDISNDEIIGFTEHKEKKQNKMATNAFVMLLKGCTEDYVHPIGYEFTTDDTDIAIISTWLTETIKKLHQFGYVVNAVVTNLSTSFIKLAQNLGVKATRPSFTVGRREVFYMYDITQIYKNICIDLSKTDFLYGDNKLICWEFIKVFYCLDKQRDVRMAPKLTDAHLDPKPSMNTTYVKELLSHEVAAGMTLDIDIGNLPDSAKDTAHFIIKLQKLLECLTSTKVHLEDSELDYLKYRMNMFFTIRPDTSLGPPNKNLNKVFIRLMMTIRVFLKLNTDLPGYRPEHIITGRFSNNSMNKFFKEIQQESGATKELTPIQFRRIFSKLTVKSMIKYSTSSIHLEDMDPTPLFETNLLFRSPVSAGIAKPLVVNTTDYRMDLPKNHAFIYVCAYLSRVISDKHSCQPFDEYMMYSEPSKYNLEILKMFEDFNKNMERNLKLKMPSKKFISFMEIYENVFLQVFDKTVLWPDIGKGLFHILSEVRFPLPCDCFPLRYLLKLFVRLRLYLAIKINNRIVTQKNITWFPEIDHL